MIIAFILGLFLGVPIGMAVIALCVVAKRGDEHCEP